MVMELQGRMKDSLLQSLLSVLLPRLNLRNQSLQIGIPPATLPLEMCAFYLVFEVLFAGLLRPLPLFMHQQSSLRGTAFKDHTTILRTKRSGKMCAAGSGVPVSLFLVPRN